MGTIREVIRDHPKGDQLVVERLFDGPVVAETFAGRIHVEWDNSAPVTPFGQLPFFIEFVKQGGLFDSLVADCPLHYTSPNAPLLGMTQVVSEDAVRRGLDKINEEAGETWTHGYLDYTTRSLLSEPWILDADHASQIGRIRTHKVQQYRRSVCCGAAT